MEDLGPYVVPVLMGIVAGWAASVLLGGKGGLIRYAILGLIGGVIGGILVPKLGLTLTDNETLNSLITATGGAVVLLAVVQFLGGKD